MVNSIVFSKVKKENIFCETFDEFEKNNGIQFSNAGIAVIYGPNGTGKTSLTRVLDCEKGSSFNVEFEGKQYSEIDNELFHIINDQNSRNIIVGETEDFLLGDDIKKEYDLQRCNC
ncbi:ATP-binding protein [Anaerobacillus isosaccharinicus]|uniref:ATP-binding protein n=1 Tax=Anaerobacillus isosaccharinicus TaxID=1532552 RepID=A0A1S2M7S4_9BACI|nr:ATP-binding protein [Anaerobacillus isosaccharinicus]MBA5587019.1 ATP-binding protein [Anaerobacillus isosaccharinicus]QOY34781.1 ATP-binding protein [Anaerobacillus isosaccharinicus]